MGFAWRDYDVTLFPPCFREMGFFRLVSFTVPDKLLLSWVSLGAIDGVTLISKEALLPSRSPICQDPVSHWFVHFLDG